MKKNRSTRLLAITICFLQLVAFQWVLPSLLLACPTCKNGLHEDGTAAAYAMSILFMMGMPFVILSCWVTTIVRLRSKTEDPSTSDLEG